MILLLLLFHWSLESPHLDQLEIDVADREPASEHPVLESQSEGTSTESQSDCSDVEIVIESQIVENEWIVTFDGFYSCSDRLKILGEILPEETFEVLPRDNPAAEFESDFDVVKLDKSTVKELENSPKIRSAREQRQLTRSLKFVNEARPDCTPAPDCNNQNVKKRDINSVSSSDVWYGPERHKSRKLMRTGRLKINFWN